MSKQSMRKVHIREKDNSCFIAIQIEDLLAFNR